MATNTYVALSTQTIGTAVSSVTFSSIPQGYTDLVIQCSVNSTSPANMLLRVGNGSVDTTGTYSNTFVYGTGSVAGSSRTSGQTSCYAGAVGGSSEFALSTIHIQNYSNATTYKTFLSRFGWLSSTTYSAVGLWRGTPAAINTLTLTSDGTNFAVGSTFSLYGIAAETAAVAKATGGTITAAADGYIYHAFTSSGTFTPSVGLTCDVLTIAGGGGAGANHGGGGGAGGLLYTSSSSFSATGYTVTVGSGGTGAAFNGSPVGSNGTNSSVNSLTAIGGGRGGDYSSSYEASDGGSGGGARSSTTNYAGLGTSGQGNNGGNKNPNYNLCGGGGGGAGGVGETATVANAGAGGIGSASYSQWGSATSTGQNVSGIRYYAGGGGGGGWNGSIPVGTYALGGYGGGGQSGPVISSGSSDGYAGTANTGGGGGCGGGGTSNGGNGGSGIVIIRYLK